MKRFVIIVVTILCLSLISCTNSIENKNENEYLTIPTEDILFVSTTNHHTFGGVHPLGYPLILKDYGKNYQYDLYVEKGFVKIKYFNVTYYKEIRNATYCDYVEWIPYEYEYKDEQIYNKDYMLVIQKDETNIIGYVIIEFININNTHCFYRAQIVESMSFPKVDGKYQDIDKEYIFNRFDEIKNSTNINKD